MKTTSIITVGLVFLVGVILLTPFSVAAKTAPGIQVTPLRTYPALDRGSTGTGTLTLTNTTTEVQSVTMSVEIFKVSGDNYDYSFSDGNESSWVSFSEAHTALQPNQSKVMTYDIAVPGDASAGGHYFSLVTTIDPPSLVNSDGITEIKRIASLLYLEVSGSITKRSALVNFSLPWFSHQQQVPVEVHISNSGTSHTRARVSLQGKTWPLKRSQEYDILEGYVLPATVRKLTGDVRLPKTPGIYHITAEYAPAQGGRAQLQKTVVYAPVWFLALLGLAILGMITISARFVLQHKQ